MRPVNVSDIESIPAHTSIMRVVLDENGKAQSSGLGSEPTGMANKMPPRLVMTIGRVDSFVSIFEASRNQ